MGIGDWIMATSQIKRMYARNKQKVCVIRKDGSPVWSEVFDNNPKICLARVGSQILSNYGGHRPYIDYANSSKERWAWKRWDIEPGEIYLSRDEIEFARPFGGRILIEPNTKIANGNKSWDWNRWRAVVEHYGAGRFVQVGKASDIRLPSVQFVDTGFRQACSVLAASVAFVGTEGALHHAAAAFDIPSVVLFSEFISPTITGYPSQRSLRHAEEACGRRIPCGTCRDSMERITVEEVIENLAAIL